MESSFACLLARSHSIGFGGGDADEEEEEEEKGLRDEALAERRGGLRDH